MAEQTIKLSTPPIQNAVLAVSGGIDSVVLLDLLSKHAHKRIIVAHFDHGIRDDSADNAVFVESLARAYEFPFISMREELGKNASEEVARTRRYLFLRKVAADHGAQLITAHHADDVVESITINLTRGTGWRGLAVLDSDIVRPLLGFFKDELRDYALSQELKWYEDSTNQSELYLRNRIRAKLADMPKETKRELLALRSAQTELKRSIDHEIAMRLVHNGDTQSRHFFTNIDADVAVEVLSSVCHRKLTRPQLSRALHAIKTYASGKSYQAGNGVELLFTTRNFTIKLIK